MTSCPFCAIVAGAIDADLVVPLSPNTWALPALRQWPDNPGHTLVLTTGHEADLVDLSQDLRAELFDQVARVAGVLPAAWEAIGTTVFQNNGSPGQTLFHLHVHVVPRFTGDGFLAPGGGADEVPRRTRVEQAEILRAALGA